MNDKPDSPNDAPPALTAPPGSPRPPRGMRAALYGFLGGLVAGMAVAILVLAGVAGEWGTIRARLAPPSEQPAVDALEHRVAALEAAAARPPAQDPEIARLEQHIAALEQAQKSTNEDPRVAALAERTDQLATQVDALRSSAHDQADLQDLVKRAETAAQTANDAAGKRQSAEALLIAVGQLRDAVERGGPYVVELAAARAVAPADAGPALDALAGAAAAGVPDHAAIAGSFPPVAAAIVRASLLPSDSDDFWSKLERKATALVSIRRIDGQGGDAASVAARAEQATKRGDLAGALEELASLEGPSAAAAKDWMTLARARLAVDRALSELAAKSAAALAPHPG